MMRVMTTAASKPSGVWRSLLAMAQTMRGAPMTPTVHSSTSVHASKVGDVVDQHLGPVVAIGRPGGSQHRHEGLAESAFTQHAAEQVGGYGTRR